MNSESSHYESTVTERGQVTLPKSLREQFGIKPGMVVRFDPSSEGLVIRKVTSGPHPIQEVFGILKDGVKTDDYLRKLRGKVE